MNKLSLIVATDKNGLIGNDGKLPWHIPWDLKYFKTKTTGANIVMGRKTYESIGRTLPNRTNIILTTNPDYDMKDCIILNSVEEVMKMSYTLNNETFIIGGVTLYNQFLPMVDNLYINEIQDVFEGDSYFPHFNESDWYTYTEKTVETDEDATLYKIKVRHLKRI